MRNTPYVKIGVSGGGVNGSLSHFSRSILVNVFNLSDTTRFANAHLYFAVCLSQHSNNIVIIAVHICISTALRVVPTKLFIRNNCLRLRKNTSICHHCLYSSAIVDAANLRLLVSSSTVYPCSSFQTAMRRNRLGYFSFAEGSSNSIISSINTS